MKAKTLPFMTLRCGECFQYLSYKDAASKDDEFVLVGCINPDCQEFGNIYRTPIVTIELEFVRHEGRLKEGS